MKIAKKRKIENEEMLSTHRKLDSSFREDRRQLAKNKRQFLMRRKKEELSLNNHLYDQRKERVLENRDIYMETLIDQKKSRIRK